MSDFDKWAKITSKYQSEYNSLNWWSFYKRYKVHEKWNYAFLMLDIIYENER